MGIMAANDRRLGKLERSVSNELSRIGPEPIRKWPEEIDQLPQDGRPGCLIPVRFGRRRILTLYGYVEFRRRQYIGNRRHVNLHAAAARITQERATKKLIRRSQEVYDTEESSILNI